MRYKNANPKLRIGLKHQEDGCFQLQLNSVGQNLKLSPSCKLTSSVLSEHCSLTDIKIEGRRVEKWQLQVTCKSGRLRLMQTVNSSIAVKGSHVTQDGSCVQR